MRTISIIAFCILLLTFFSCKKDNDTKETPTKTLRRDTLKTKNKSNDNLLMFIDLNVITSLNENSKTNFFENGEPLTKYLYLELIDKSLFDSKKETVVNFILADTTAIKKNNGIIEIKCENKTVKYVDKPEDNDGMQIFNYSGQIEFLNKYLIATSYYEGGDYKLVDKTTGDETNLLVDYPYISPDKKNIICINSNGYESTADLELYDINDKNVKRKMSASFKNWMPVMENGEIFWSTDGYLYLIVHNVKSFWKEDGQLNDKYQFIRMKIL